MTTLGGTGYDNLLVATNDNGLIDYSFIDMTTSKSGNKLVQTLDSGLININLLPTSTTGANNKIPITTSGNVLSNTWLNTTNGTETLAAGKVVVTGSDKLISNNLLNTTDGSTTTESANSSKIVKTTTAGKINDNLLKTTKSGGPANANTIVKLDSNGLLDPSLFRNDQFIPLTGGEPSGNILVIRPGDSANKTLEDLKSKYPNFYGFGSSSYTDGFLMGMNGTSNSDNYLVIATLDDGNEPIYVRQYAGSQGYLNMPNNKVNEITLMDKNGYTSLINLSVNKNLTVTTGSLSVPNGDTNIGKNLTVGGNTTVNNSLYVENNIDVNSGNIIVNSKTTYPSDPINQARLKEELPEFSGFSSAAYLDEGKVGDTDTYLLIATYDNGNEPIVFRQYQSWNKTGDSKQHFKDTNISHEVVLMDKSGNSTLNSITASSISVTGALNSNSLSTGAITATGDITATGKTLNIGAINATGNITATGKTLNIGAITATGNITATGKTLNIGAITATGDITATNKTVTAGNFNGKWSNFTQDIGTQPSIADSTWILLNNSSKIQHTTIGTIATSAVNSGRDASFKSITATGDINASGKTITAGNYNGKWGGVTNQITTHDTAPDLTRWMLTYVDGYIRYITMSEMADKMKSTINSGIDMSSKAPKPTTANTVGKVGVIHLTTATRDFTFPSGGSYWYFYIYADYRGWWWDVTNCASGIAAGGDVLHSDNNRLEGFYFRIS